MGMGESPGLPLRPTLVSVVAVLILLGAGGVGGLAYGSSSKIVDHLWSGYADQLAEAATQRTLRYFDSAAPYVALTNDEALDNQLRIGPFDPESLPLPLLEHFRAAIEAHAEFTWASFGAADGTYVAVHRDAEGGIRAAWRTQLGEGRTRMRELVPDTDVPEGWRVIEDEVGHYDPTERPWYHAASESRDGLWVEPFVFATVQEPGFMYARPHHRRGELQGVWAVEYEMSDLSDYLSQMQVGETGRVYVVSHSGDVVGHPNGETTVLVDGEMTIAQAGTHADPMLQGAWEAAEATHTRQSFRTDDYLVMVEPFPEATGIGWSVLVVAPEADFFGPVRAQAKFGVIVALIAALLAIFCGVYFSNRIAGALRVLAAELDRIGQFDLEHRELNGAKSLVREVNEMHATTERMKASLRSFGKYIPSEVVRDLIVGGEEAVVGGKPADLTVLFSDIAGFTSVAEKLDPDVVIQMLAEYLDELSDAIRARQGTVDKYIGDAIMAFWGAPRDDEDHALHGCEGALAMQEALAVLQEQWAERGLPRLDTRIGLNTGEMLVGNFGANTRINYTVMGDPVNLGARIEALNKRYGTRIMVGAQTAERVKDAMVLRPLERVAVKGKDEAVLLYELVGRVGEVDDETLQAIEAYSNALDAYNAQDFEVAVEAFEALAVTGDRAAELMATQAREFLATPPPKDWNGAVAMTSK